MTCEHERGDLANGTVKQLPPAGPPLAGLTVVDLSRVLAGPFATMLLGDLGAQVIKVERPGAGDDTRNWGPPFVGLEGEQQSTYFLSANRNKRSIMLDLRADEDLATLKSLLRHADVLVENFRPGVMDRLGLSAEILEELNPSLVSLSISGFGSIGPDRTRVGYDQILQAEGGLMSLTGLGVPTRVGVPVADLTAGLLGLVGVLAALLERTRSDLGQQVHTSLLAGMIALHTFQATRYLVAGEVPTPSGNQHPTVCPYGMFWTEDAPIVLAVGNQIIWQRFAPLVGIAADDAPFRDNATRLANAARPGGAHQHRTSNQAHSALDGRLRCRRRARRRGQDPRQGLRQSARRGGGPRHRGDAPHPRCHPPARQPAEIQPLAAGASQTSTATG